MPKSQPAEGTKSKIDGYDVVYSGGTWKFAENATPTSSSVSYSTTQSATKNQTISNIDQINRQRGAELFQVSNEGKLIINPNLSDKSKMEVQQLAQRYGLQVGGEVGGLVQRTVQSAATSAQATSSAPSSSSSTGGQNWSWAFTGKNVRASDYSPVDITKEDVLQNPEAAQNILNQNKYGGVYSITRTPGGVQIQETYPTYTPLPLPRQKDDSIIIKPVGAEDYVEQQQHKYLVGFKQFNQVNPILGNQMSMLGVDKYISERAAQVYVGMEQLQAATYMPSYKEKYKTYSNELLIFEGVGRVGGTSVLGVAEGAGTGALIGGGVLAASGGATAQYGLNVGINAFKMGATMTAIDAGVLAITGKDWGEAFKPDRVVSNTVVGLGVATLSVPVAISVDKMGFGLKTSSTLKGAFAGSMFGTAFTAREHPEFSVGGGVIGAVAGGALGLGSAVLEEHKTKIVFGLAEQYKVKGGKTEFNEIKGIKVGVERITSGNEAEFFGGAITKEGVYFGKGKQLVELYKFKTNVVAPDEVVIPKGIFELKAYGSPKYTESFKGMASEFFAGRPLDHDIVRSNLINSAKGDVDNIIASARGSGGVFGGSNVEKSIGSLKYVNPRFDKAGDIDLVFYSQSDYDKFLKALGGATSVKTQAGLGAENPYFLKYAVKTAAGSKIDVSVIQPSIAMPKAPSPLSAYDSLFSFTRSSKMTTYSPQQQIASKFMAVGINAAGDVKPLEPTKVKYLVDVASFGSKSREETMNKLASMNVNVKGISNMISPSPITLTPSVPLTASTNVFKTSVSNSAISKTSLVSYSRSSSNSKSSSLSSSSSSTSFSSYSFSYDNSSSGSSSLSRSSISISSKSISTSSSSIPNININIARIPEPLGGIGGGLLSLGGLGGKALKTSIRKNLKSLLGPTVSLASPRKRRRKR